MNSIPGHERLTAKKEADLRMVSRVLALIVAAPCLTGCGNGTPVEEQAKPAEPTLVGADRDAHGCIGSAGYAWCARTNQCERPWELAKAQGLGEDASAFQQFCSASPGP